MSVKVSSWVWHSEEAKGVAGNELVLLLALADVADDKGRCRYIDDEGDLTYSVLAAKVRVSRSTVIRMVAKLRERGLLAHVPGTKRHANEFRVLVPWAESSGFNLEPNDSDSVSTANGFGSKSDARTSLIRIDVITSAFDEFYRVYPRHVGKEAARKAFIAAARSTDPAVIVAGARRFAADPNLPERHFIPHPSTWLSRGSWDDEPLPPRVTSAAGPGPVREEQFAPGDEWLAFNR